ncbi:MAG: MATE family efflux transporter [Eubacteriales bacterium]|nr:MATE family efflux transporter [Eubacteriales bacterium]
MKADEIFGKGSVWKGIFRMSIPAVITMMVMIIYNMADMYFVGKTGDELQIAAISLTSPVYMLQTAVGTLVGAGGCAAISNALGTGNKELVKALSSVCIILLLVSSFVIGGGILLFPDVILKLLGVDTETWQYTKEYITVLAIGMIFMLFTNIFANVVRAEGAARESMIGNGIGTILNIVLDPVFILGLHMGVRGAAIATVLGNVAGSIYYVHYILKSNSQLVLSIKYAAEKPEAFVKVISLGIPNAVSNFLNGMTGTISNHILISYGASAIVTVSVGGKASMIASMIVMGICIGVQPFIAYNYGARNKERTKEVLYKTAVTSLAVGLALTIGCYFMRISIAEMFLKDEKLIETSVHIMSIQLLTTAFIGLYYIGINFLQSAGNAFGATVLSICRQGIIYVPAIFLLHAAVGLEGVYWVNVVCDSVSVVLAMMLLVRQMKKGFSQSW